MLSRIRKAQEESEGGFTLIELLVVMIIIGILAAIAIPAFLSQKKKGYEASEKADLRSVATEIATQLVDNPTAMTIGASGTTGILLTPTPGSPSTTVLSPGNVYGAGFIDITTGAYCVSLTNAKAGNNWKIVNSTGAAAQVLATGGCTSSAG